MNQAHLQDKLDIHWAQAYFESTNLNTCAELRTKSMKLFCYSITRYMSEEFLYKISSKYLEAYNSYQRKTGPAKFGVPPCIRNESQVYKNQKEKASK